MSLSKGRKSVDSQRPAPLKKNQPSTSFSNARDSTVIASEITARKQPHTSSSARPLSQAPEPILEAMPTAMKHSRHDSAMANPPPAVPKRTSSFKGVLNAYYKIFGGHPPRKPPKNEKPAEEMDRLRRTMRKYEKQLEEASNTLLLQDKVLANWEKRGWKAKKEDIQMEEQSLTDSAIPTAELEARDTEKRLEAGLPITELPDKGSRLSILRESSREMLRDIPAPPKEESEDATTQDETPRGNTEHISKGLEAAQATSKEQTEEYAALKLAATEALQATTEVKEQLEKQVETLKAQLEAAKAFAITNSDREDGAGDHGRSIEAGPDVIAEYKYRVAQLEKELGEERHAHNVDFTTHTNPTPKELAAVQEARAFKEVELEGLTKSLDEARAAHQDTQAALESIKAKLAEEKALSPTDGITPVPREAERFDHLSDQEATLNDTIQKLETANAKIAKLSADLEIAAKDQADADRDLVSARGGAEIFKGGLFGGSRKRHEALKKDLNGAQTKVNQLNKDLESITKDRNDLKSALEAAYAANEKLKTTSQNPETEDSSWKDQVTALQEELASLQANSNVAEARILELSAVIDQHNSTREKLETSQSELEELKQNAERHAALQSDHEAAQIRLTELQNELDGHVSLKKNLKKEIDHHVATESALEREVQSLSALKGELELAHARNMELSNDSESHAATKAELESAHSRIEELSKITDGHAITQSELETTRARLAELDQQLEGQLASRSELESRVADLQKDNEVHAETKAELEVAHSRIAELQERSIIGDDASAELDVAKVRIDALKKEIESLATVKSDLEIARSHLAELDQLADTHEKEKAEHEVTRSKISELSKEVEAHGLIKSELAQLVEAHAAVKAENEATISQVSQLSKEIEAHEAVKSELSKLAEAQTKEKIEHEATEDRVAHLSKELEDHEAVKSELAQVSEAHNAEKSEHEATKARFADLSKKIEAHQAVKSELAQTSDALTLEKTEHETTKAKIADLSKQIEAHEAEKAGLSQISEAHTAEKAEHENTRARVADLLKEIEAHEAVKAELAQISKAHSAEKIEHEATKAKVADLSKEIEGHQTVHQELSSAQERLAALEKDLKTGKTDHETVIERLTTTEAALAVATADHQKGVHDLEAKDKEVASLHSDLQGISKEVSTKDAALREAENALHKSNEAKDKELADLHSDLQDISKELSKKDAALREAKEALHKSKEATAELDALTKKHDQAIAGFEELTKKHKEAEDRVKAADEIHKASLESHVAEKGILTAKMADLEKVSDHNEQLVKELESSKQSEHAATTAYKKLEEEMQTLRKSHTAAEASRAIPENLDDRKERSSFTTAVSTGGAAVAGALGISKAIEHHDKESTSKDIDEVAVEPDEYDHSTPEELTETKTEDSGSALHSADGASNDVPVTDKEISKLPSPDNGAVVPETLQDGFAERDEAPHEEANKDEVSRNEEQVTTGFENAIKSPEEHNTTKLDEQGHSASNTESLEQPTEDNKANVDKGGEAGPSDEESTVKTPQSLMDSAEPDPLEAGADREKVVSNHIADSATVDQEIIPENPAEPEKIDESSTKSTVDNNGVSVHPEHGTPEPQSALESTAGNLPSSHAGAADQLDKNDTVPDLDDNEVAGNDDNKSEPEIKDELMRSTVAKNNAEPTDKEDGVETADVIPATEKSPPEVDDEDRNNVTEPASELSNEHDEQKGSADNVEPSQPVNGFDDEPKSSKDLETSATETVPFHDNGHTATTSDDPSSQVDKERAGNELDSTEAEVTEKSICKEDSDNGKEASQPTEEVPDESQLSQGLHSDIGATKPNKGDSKEEHPLASEVPSLEANAVDNEVEQLHTEDPIEKGDKIISDSEHLSIHPKSESGETQKSMDPEVKTADSKESAWGSAEAEDTATPVTESQTNHEAIEVQKDEPSESLPEDEHAQSLYQSTDSESATGDIKSPDHLWRPRPITALSHSLSTEQVLRNGDFSEEPESTVDASADGTPISPASSTKRKSVRWEDLESPRQQTPVEEIPALIHQSETNTTHHDDEDDKTPAQDEADVSETSKEPRVNAESSTTHELEQGPKYDDKIPSEVESKPKADRSTPNVDECADAVPETISRDEQSHDHPKITTDTALPDELEGKERMIDQRETLSKSVEELETNSKNRPELESEPKDNESVSTRSEEGRTSAPETESKETGSKDVESKVAESKDKDSRDDESRDEVSSLTHSSEHHSALSRDHELNDKTEDIRSNDEPTTSDGVNKGEENSQGNNEQKTENKPQAHAGREAHDEPPTKEGDEKMEQLSQQQDKQTEERHPDSNLLSKEKAMNDSYVTRGKNSQLESKHIEEGRDGANDNDA